MVAIAEDDEEESESWDEEEEEEEEEEECACLYSLRKGEVISLLLFSTARRGEGSSALRFALNI